MAAVAEGACPARVVAPDERADPVRAVGRGLGDLPRPLAPLLQPDHLPVRALGGVVGGSVALAEFLLGVVRREGERS